MIVLYNQSVLPFSLSAINNHIIPLLYFLLLYYINSSLHSDLTLNWNYLRESYANKDKYMLINVYVT